MNRRLLYYYYNGLPDAPGLTPGMTASAALASTWIQAGGTVLLPVNVVGTAFISSIPASTTIRPFFGGTTTWSFNLGSNETGLYLGTNAINSATINSAWGVSHRVTSGTTSGSSALHISSASSHFAAGDYAWVQQGTWAGTTFTPSQVTHAISGEKRFMGGWLTRVSSATPSVVNIEDGLPYNAIEGLAVFNVTSLVVRNLTINNVAFNNTSPTNTGFACLVVNMADSPILTHVSANNSRVNGIALQCTRNGEVNNPTTNNIGPVIPEAGTGYSIQLRMVRGLGVYNAVMDNARVGVQRDDGCINLTISQPTGTAVQLVRNHGGPDFNVNINGGGTALSDFAEGNESWRIGARGPVTYNGVTGELLQVGARSAGTITWTGGTLGLCQFFPGANDANAAWSVSGNTPISLTNVVLGQSYEDVINVTGTTVATVAVSISGSTLTCGSSTHKMLRLQSSSASTFSIQNSNLSYTNTSSTINGFVYGEGSGSATVGFTSATLSKAGTNTAAAVSTVAGMTVTISAATGSTINGTTFTTSSTVTRV